MFALFSKGTVHRIPSWFEPTLAQKFCDSYECIAGTPFEDAGEIECNAFGCDDSMCCEPGNCTEHPQKVEF